MKSCLRDDEKLILELEHLDFGDFTFFTQQVEEMATKMLKEDKPKTPKREVVICPRCGKIVSGLDDAEQRKIC